MKQKEDRIPNPESVDRAAIEAKIAKGIHVILQFSHPCYSPKLLGAINNLCGEFGSSLEVRFYGHHGDKFDASNLRFLPEVAALSMDCLSDATNLSALNELVNLRWLRLGIYRLNDPSVLKPLQLQKLERLSLCDTAKSNIDLASLEVCKNLEEIFLEGHTKNIAAMTGLCHLRTLTLRSIPKNHKIGFVSKIQSLRRLVIILGGRENISEIHHPMLEELEVLRVRGISNIDTIETFLSLRSFRIEDQIRLENIRFTPRSKKIQSLIIHNCKALRNLDGLSHLAELRSVRIGMTSLHIDSILGQNLPASLKVIGFYTGKSKENALIRSKLDALGYLPYERRHL